MAARLPEGGRAHICATCVTSGKYKVTYGEMRTVKVEVKGKIKAKQNGNS